MSDFEREREPADYLEEVITAWKPGTLDPSQVVDNISWKLGRPIDGQERCSLETVAEDLIEHDVQENSKITEITE